MVQEGETTERRRKTRRRGRGHLVLQVGCQVGVLWGVGVVQQLPVAWIH